MDIVEYTEDFTHGACTDMPNADYHDSDAVSLTKLKAALGSVEIYYRTYVSKDMPRTTSDALRKGSAQHAFTLEGSEAFARDFCLTPDLPYRKEEDKWNSILAMNNTLHNPLDLDDLKPLVKYKKEDMLAFFAGFPGKQHVTKEEADIIQKVDRSIKTHPVASALLAEGLPEVSFRSAMNKDAGFRIQCRTDWINPEGCEASEGLPYIADLKTVGSLDMWEKNYNNLDYWLQEPFYLETIAQSMGKRLAERLYFIVAETQYPYRVKVVVPDPEDTTLGLHAIQSGFSRIAHGFNSGNWNDAGWDTVQIQPMAGWKRREVENSI